MEGVIEEGQQPIMTRARSSSRFSRFSRRRTSDAPQMRNSELPQQEDTDLTLGAISQQSFPQLSQMTESQNPQYSNPPSMNENGEENYENTEWDFLFCVVNGSGIKMRQGSDIPSVSILNLLLGIHFIVSILFTRATFFAAQTYPASGFTVVLIGCLLPMYSIVTYILLNFRQSAMGLGFIGGISFYMSFFLLTSSIFWAEISKCYQSGVYISFFKCSNTADMKHMRMMSDIMFIFQIIVAAFIIHRRGDLVSPLAPKDINTPFQV